jgi:radical SAM/Cys-rich protein
MAGELIIADGNQQTGKRALTIAPFSQVLAEQDLELKRGKTTTLQINVGLRCNQACRHCHLEAGPDRNEMMTWETFAEVVAFARRSSVEVIDITGGAPELHPRITEILARLAPLAKRTLFRCNLTVLSDQRKDDLLEVCRAHRVVMIASFPSLDAAQTEAQRGTGVFMKSILALKRLNDMGYACPGSELELNLVSNPSGAFLPVPQAQTEKKFQQVLKEKYGIVFGQLYTFSNVPLGRFRRWLLHSGNFEKYMHKLASSFNASTLEGLMCRSLVSVGWDGSLFDCDFNLAAGIQMGGRRRHISEMAGLPEAGETIATSDHCYACTAGSGFT